MSEIQFHVELKVRAPFLFKSGAALPLGLDAATLTAQDGSAMIPGSHLRGHLRHAWEEFAEFGALDADWIGEWLGAESATQSSDAPKRGRLDFDAHWRAVPAGGISALSRDVWMSLPAARALQSRDVPVRFRVRIDDETGVADAGALQLIGQTHAAGTEVSFVGSITARNISKAQQQELKRRLEQALEWIPALGALKGIGFGQRVGATVKIEQKSAITMDASLTDSAPRLGLKFALDRPFCFGARAIESNRFESVPYVPGGALRGALFAWCEETAKGEGDQASAARDILAHAHAIQIRHGWAGRTDQRMAAVIPCSAIAIGGGKFVDASEQRYAAPFLVRDSAGNTQIPAFPSDWKEQYGQFDKLHHLLTPDLRVDVRTAIDAGTGSARETALFSLDCRLHADANGAHTFRSEIILRIEDQETRAKLWKSLSGVLPQALHHLGKTEARAQDLAWYLPPEVDADPQSERLVITLLSDALLSQLPLVQSDATHGSTLTDYLNFFDEHCEGALRLLDLHADQKLVGGSYFQRRFWSEEAHYRPRVLTLAGSVFVFKVVDQERAKHYLTQWLSAGLPSADGDDWKKNPYLPANGYGEIRIGTGICSSQLEPDQVIPVESVTSASEATA